ncbi:MAG: phenylacetic acid degradation protein PaaB [Ilumatobacteraceae bacterium]
MSTQPELDAVYEVFLQIGGNGKPVQLAGSVRASDRELAWQSAKEIYTRREDCTVLWVVPRGCIYEGDEALRETLSHGTGREFRIPGFPSSHRRERGDRGVVVEL